MTRRSGLSLIEVLVALFIMGLGVIAILTMFPLGAYQMAVAVREDRSAQSAAAADAYIRTYWKAYVVQGPNPPTETFYNALSDPNAGLTGGLSAFARTPPAAGGLPLASLNEPGYPVLTDPMGYVARSGASQVWGGDGGATNAPRRILNQIVNNQHAQRVCSLMDGLAYDDDGRPVNPAAPTSADRELRYNWLWVVQRTNANPFAASLTVVVFDRRAHLYAPAGSEQVFTATANVGTSSVALSGTPDVKPGGWIMDATVTQISAGGPWIRNANFYRVTAVNGNTLELQSPIKTPTTALSPAPGSYTGTFVVMRGVSGVYVRPPLSAND